MNESEYDADQEDEEEALGMESALPYVERISDSNRPDDDIEYIGLTWNGRVLIPDKESTSKCLDLSGTYLLPFAAFKLLNTNRWEHLRFNLTDNSVFGWLDSSLQIQKNLKEIIVCLPEPRGFEDAGTYEVSQPGTSSSRRQRQHLNHKKKRQRRRRKTTSSSTQPTPVSLGGGGGIEGFLRRGVEQFSFQASLTAWFQQVDQFFKTTRPGPFWWPARTPSKFCEAEPRFLSIVSLLQNLGNITVIMGPCSRMGYKNLDSLMEQIHKVRDKVTLVLQYVDEDGIEDAYLEIEDCEYLITSQLSGKYEEFEAIRRVDGTSLQFFEWIKWIFWISLNLLLWVLILRLLWFVIFRS